MLAAKGLKKSFPDKILSNARDIRECLSHNFHKNGFLGERYEYSRLG